MLDETRGHVVLTLQTDVLVDGRAVEGIDERFLLFPSARVHLEVATDEELAGHVGYSVLLEVVWEGYADKDEGKRRFGEGNGGGSIGLLSLGRSSIAEARRDPSRHLLSTSYLIFGA